MTRYCGQDFTPEEFQQIRSLIKQNPEFNRMRLSKEVCRMLQWLKPDGNLKDMSCRVAMLRMHRDGLIELPPPTHVKGPLKKIEFTWAHLEKVGFISWPPVLSQLQDFSAYSNALI